MLRRIFLNPLDVQFTQGIAFPNFADGRSPELSVKDIQAELWPVAANAEAAEQILNGTFLTKHNPRATAPDSLVKLSPLPRGLDEVQNARLERGAGVGRGDDALLGAGLLLL